MMKTNRRLMDLISTRRRHSTGKSSVTPSSDQTVELKFKMEADENVEIVKLTKNMKKLFRKQERVKAILKCDGIEVKIHPTRFVVIANFGFTTGASQEEIYEYFTKYGRIQRVILVPDKQYAFLEFSMVKEAENAIAGCQNMEISIRDDGKINLLLAYVDCVPEEKTSLLSDDMPPGLILLKDFVSENYENELLKCLKWEDSTLLTEDKQYLKHRRVQHFGYEFKYDTSNIDKETPLERKIPDVCQPLLDKLLTNGYYSTQPDQLTVNQYEPGQGIPPHVDTHSAFEDEIVSLSLGSSVVMNFTNLSGEQKSVYLPRRSVLIMTKESRFCWTHGIVPRKTDIVRATDGGLTLQYRQSRTSFTFRKIRQNNSCNCDYPEKCDSQQNKFQNTNETPNEIEGVYVQKVYDAIAEHFSATRHKPWPRVVEFLQSLPPGSIILDVGCGNGKYFDANSNTIHIGCDQSIKLLDICHGRRHEVFADDVVHLSVRPRCADACICIAVIHHLSTQERRLAAISNLVNTVRKNGVVLIYVWALEQDLDSKKSAYIKESRARTVQKATPPNHDYQNGNTSQDGHNLPFPVHVNRTHFMHPDILVPWSLKKGVTNSEPEKSNHEQSSNVFYRYYHLFQSGELEKLCSQIPDTQITKCYYDSGNWCIILKRIN